MKCQPECQKFKQNVFYALCYLSNHIAFDRKVIFHRLGFPQVVQKQMLGEVEN